jgi:cell division transport system ATP-binding protein
MILFDNVSKRYHDDHEALKQVSFELHTGEMAFLTGHSGAGKSTLLKLILLLERPTRGTILVNQQMLASVKRFQIPKLRRSIGMIFQDPHLLSDYNVYDNVAIPLIISGYRPEEVGRRVRAALDKVGLLNKEKTNVTHLSMGERERVSIARAVVNKPDIILADEPTGNLDPELSSEIMKLFERFNQVGVTVLIATHDLALIGHMKHRILTLHQGRMVSTGVRLNYEYERTPADETS